MTANLKTAAGRSAARKKPARVGVVQKLVQLVGLTVEAVGERAAVQPNQEFTLQPVNPVRIVAAYSGGRDSTALVEALARLKNSPRQTRIAAVTVVHVHHGLSKNADAWAEHAQAACARWKLPLVVEHVYVNPRASSGEEPAAREARYRALLKVAHSVGADVIMTAHHLDDRLETFLIQWIRGAGPEGLAAMSPVKPLETARTPTAGSDSAGEIVLARPWLDVSGAEIAEFAKRTKLSWVEDESNGDSRFLRNLIRNEMLPHLDEVRPGWRAAAARSITLVAQASEVINTVGEDDCARCRAGTDRTLNIAKLLALPVARQSLCLRSWLTAAGLRAPSLSRTRDILRQLRDSRTDTRLSVRIESMEIRRWGADIVLRPSEKDAGCNVQVRDLVWTGEAELSLGVWGGVLRFETCAPDEDGIDAALLKKGPLQVRPRKGGEKIKLHRLRPSRHLKHLYQAAGVPAFERSLLPLVWLDGRLVFAAGLGTDVREFADRDLVPERIRLVWVPDRPLLSFDGTAP